VGRQTADGQPDVWACEAVSSRWDSVVAAGSIRCVVGTERIGRRKMRRWIQLARALLLAGHRIHGSRRIPFRGFRDGMVAGGRFLLG
jgi:hypothetical protein